MGRTIADEHPRKTSQIGASPECAPEGLIRYSSQDVPQAVSDRISTHGFSPYRFDDRFGAKEDWDSLKGCVYHMPEARVHLVGTQRVLDSTSPKWWVVKMNVLADEWSYELMRDLDGWFVQDYGLTCALMESSGFEHVSYFAGLVLMKGDLNPITIPLRREHAEHVYLHDGNRQHPLGLRKFRFVSAHGFIVPAPVGVNS